MLLFQLIFNEYKIQIHIPSHLAYHLPHSTTHLATEAVGTLVSGLRETTKEGASVGLVGRGCTGEGAERMVW